MDAVFIWLSNLRDYKECRERDVDYKVVQRAGGGKSAINSKTIQHEYYSKKWCSQKQKLVNFIQIFSSMCFFFHVQNKQKRELHVDK